MNKALMTHVVAGYPSMKECEELVVMMAENGATLIEIQIPFSDPVADGPVILAANQAALESGVSVEDCFKLMERLLARVEVPLLFMSYFNILHHYGVSNFVARCADLGVYGLIVPDIPLDEEDYEGYLKACYEFGVKAIQIISPLTPEKRLEKIGQVADGFVYCVSRYGTTGIGDNLNPQLSSYLKKVRKHVQLPLAVGFGISSAKNVQAVWKEAEIAVIGSAVLKMVNKGDGYLAKVKKFLNSL